MQLEQFVHQSLVSIADGVLAAQQELQLKQVLVNSSMRGQSGNAENWAHYGRDSRGCPVFAVDFDVAVTVTEETGSKQGIGVVSGIFAVGGQQREDSKNTAVTRLQFKVPISYPHVRSKTAT
jgi:hypothetical protein